MSSYFQDIGTAQYPQPEFPVIQDKALAHRTITKNSRLFTWLTKIQSFN